MLILLGEVFITACIIFQLIFSASIINKTKNNFPLIAKESAYQSFFILFIAILLVIFIFLEKSTFSFIFAINYGNTNIKIIVLGLSALLIIMLLPALKVQKLNFFEFFTFFLLSVLSLLLLISTENLMFFYLTLEMQTLCFYVLSTFNRKSAFSTEAGLKYFLLSSFMSAFLLLGIIIFYSCLGTLNLPEIYNLLTFDFFNPTLKLILNYASIFVVLVLLFKLACAPFHFWAPDVYEGAPLSATLVFSMIPKIGFLIFFVKWIFCLNIIAKNFVTILLFLGVFSCIIGTLFSLYQKRLKRLIIFSSIAQVGFLVCGLSLNSIESSSALFSFLFIYLITSFLIWGHIVVFYVFQSKISNFFSLGINSLHITGLSGFFIKNSIWAISLLLIFFSIAGIPPLAGFFAKIIIVLELLIKKNFISSILLILISSISVFYYIRVLKILFFEKKIKKNQEDRFQIIFTNKNYQKLYFIFILFLLFLTFFIFFPSGLSLLSGYIQISVIS